MSIVEKLIDEITKGLRTTDGDPVTWLAEYVDRLKNDDCISIAMDNEETSSSPMSPPKAMVIDCGTGETKILIYSWINNTVVVEEITKFGPASEYLDNPSSLESVIKFYKRQHKPDMVLVAASAWLRNSTGDELRKGNILLQQLMGSGVICKLLEKNEEGWFEITAVEFASQRMKLNLNGSWAAGAGSTQLNFNFNQLSNLQIGNKRGHFLISTLGHRGISSWRSEVKTVLQEFLLTTPLKLTGNILGMSAVYYAAKSVNLPDQVMIPYEVVKTSFESYILTQCNKSVLSSEDTRNLSNVIQQLETLLLLVDEKSYLFFARDLILDSYPFRITWSCGWYIHLLDEMRVIIFPGESLKRFRALISTLEHKGEVVILAGGVSESQSIKSDRLATTGSVLLDLERVIEVLFTKAKYVEGQTTQLLEHFTLSTNAYLAGLEYKFKEKNSLARKLRTRLQTILQKQQFQPFFIPRISDIIYEVDDILRYTVVAEPVIYTEVVTTCLESLKETLGCSYKCFSFWVPGSTYFGINAFVTTFTNFTFELQFHTSESLTTKQNISHQLYERFRELTPGPDKLNIYRQMKAIWCSIAIPDGIEKIVSPEPMTNWLMEQLERIEAFANFFHQIPVVGSEGEAVSGPVLDTRGLCCRLIRGKKEEEFTHLGYPHDKRLVWVAGPEILPQLLGLSKERLPEVVGNLMGKPLAWVQGKLKEGYAWKLLVMPQLSCVRADWKGLSAAVQKAYPEIAGTMARFTPHLETTHFETIQGTLPPPSNTFRDLKNGGEEGSSAYVTLSRLQNEVEPTLWQLRGFLFNEVGVNELFSGDGYTYNERGERQGEEYLCENMVISKVVGCRSFDLI